VINHSLRIQTSRLVVLTLLLAGPSVVPAQEVGPPGGSILTGKVVASDGKSRIAGATVLAYHLSTETMHRSEPTDSKGRFRFEGLNLGYYDLAVQTPDGLFVGNQVINVPPAGKAEIDLTVTSYDELGAAAPEPREFPEVQLAALGAAQVQEGMTGKQYWRSPTGIAILGGIGGAILLGIALSGKEDSATAF